MNQLMYQPLKNRLEDLPLVLAGPIVRHTDRRGVSIWLALRRAAKVTLRVFEVDHQTLSEIPTISGEDHTLPMGANLHLVLVNARGRADALALGTTYAYELHFEEASGKRSFEEAVSDLNALTYPPFSLPTFCLPPTCLDRTHLLYGSCRKPHGGGRDSLAGADDILARSIAGRNVRPAHLYLCGDQIYADDVADALLRVAIDVSRCLLGEDEPLPDTRKRRQLWPGYRRRTCRKAGLTSRFCKSHVFRLGEYLALYLLVWSEELWPETMPGFEDLFPRRTFYPPLLRGTAWALHGRLRKRRYKMEGVFQAEIDKLNTFREGLLAVRRLLANISTYMIFDDHEVTDDWYLNRRWTSKVLRKPLGRRMLTNAQVAYALCQGWGNQPDYYRRGPASELLEHASDFVMKGYPESSVAAMERLIGLPTPHHLMSGLDRDPDQTVLWHYRVYGPAFEVWVLDTRTWRGFPGARGTSIPNLISGHGWVQLDHPARDETKVTLVIAPTNVIDVPFTAWISKVAAQVVDVFFSDYGDTWEAQTDAFEELLGRLATLWGPGPCNYVFLSGDVHYGFATRIQYWGHHPYKGMAQKAETEAVMAQLTSSPFHNEDAMTLFFQKRGYWPTFPKVMAWAGWNSQPWLQIGSLRGRLKSFYQSFRRRSVRHEPPLLNLENLPRNLEVEPHPHWRYRIDFLRGERSPHPKHDSQQASLGSEIVGTNNVGELSFRLDDRGTSTVIQSLWWYPDDTAALAPLTQFEVSLDQDDPAYPKPLLPGE